MSERVIEQLLSSGPLGVAVLVLGFVVIRLYRDNQQLHKQLRDERKEMTETLLGQNDKIHDTVNRLAELVDRTTTTRPRQLSSSGR